MTTFSLVLLLTLTAYVAGQSCPSGPMTEALRKKMLDVHNDDRSSVAKGTAKRSPRRAKNMYKLSWDCDLEKQAQQWASRCVYAHSGMSQVGENIFAQMASYALKIDESTMQTAADSWWKEYEQYGVSDPSYKFSGAMGQIGHWTQMAWGKTTKVGCGVAECPNMFPGWKGSLFVVCQYKQQGNFMGEQIYDFGNGCSADSDCTLFPGSKCERESSLCKAP